MAENTKRGGGRRGSRWRIAAWGAAALVLLLPLVAMQITDEVNWGVADFAIFGGMLAVACGIYELAAKLTGDSAYGAGVGVALAAAFILVWLNLAVGIIGTEDNPANLMFGGVLAVAIIGVMVARFQPGGVARALVATALAQALIAAIAMIAGIGHPASPPLEILAVNAVFAALWLVSARLFQKAAREKAPVCSS